MLRFARQSEEFLETPAVLEAASLLGDVTERWSPRGASPPSSSPSIDGARFIPGDIVAGRYRIVGLLGRGGMGEVYRADDLKLSQPVALKFLSQELSSNGAALARFHREVSVARQISHRHVCRVYDIGEEQGTHFLSMELVRGEELSSLLKRIGRLPMDKAVITARQLCAGLAAIHAARVLHRDLKPQNVMLDEHGDVRITDFGVAALADGVRGREAAIGTPAYMSPEQLAGGELTLRSDLYALGLVLYEFFTGNRPFPGTSLAEIISTRSGAVPPPNPSAAVGGLDPSVEAIILQCLQTDPERRPASALEVAAALPGGDPLAAALAAGETPSPEMVAASSRKGGLRPLSAILLLVWIGLALVGSAFLSDRTSLHRALPVDKSYEVLRARAADLARDVAGAPTAGDSAAGFVVDYEALVATPLEAGVSPMLIRFWYRQSPHPLDPLNGWSVNSEDPPNDEPGMVGMRFDAAGHLQRLELVPLPESSNKPAKAVQWERLFQAAGLTIEEFTPAASSWIPPRFGDERRTWTGHHPRLPDTPLRIEAAAYRGTPTHFEVVPPWQKPLAREPEDGAAFLTVLLILYFGAMSLALLLAWKNLSLGRGDRRGAFRLTLFVFVARLVVWLFAAHHTPSFTEATRFVNGLQSALYWAMLLGLFYLALEPFVRRRWPLWIVSSTRLLAGNVRDPLIGRDLLVGGALGMGLVVSHHLFSLGPLLEGETAIVPSTNSPILYTLGLLGARGFVPLLVNQMSAAIMFPMIILSVVLFLALLTRSTKAAVVLAWIVLYVPIALNFGRGTPLGLAIALIMPTILIVALSRYGLLALMTAMFYQHLWPFYPATTQLSAWYATSYLFGLALLTAIALYAFRTSLAGQQIVRRDFLDG